MESLDLFFCSPFLEPWLEECLWPGCCLSAELSERTLERGPAVRRGEGGTFLLPTVFMTGEGKRMSEISLKNQGVLWGGGGLGLKKREKKKCRWGGCRVYCWILYPKRTGYWGKVLHCLLKVEMLEFGWAQWLWAGEAPPFHKFSLQDRRALCCWLDHEITGYHFLLRCFWGGTHSNS